MASAFRGFASSMGGAFRRGVGKLPGLITRTHVAFVAGAVTAMPALTGEEFFEHKFITDKDPDAIQDFYSTEDFLQILGVFPFAIHFVLAGVEWDLEKENTMRVHNAMEISFTLEEREEVDEDGNTVIAFFQKVERFKNFIPFTPFLMWDQTQCYGYNRLSNGTSEVFHRGKTFFGPLPVRFLVQLHAHYVIWATEKHINSPAFGVADLETQEHQRSNIPLHAVADFVNRLYVAQKIAVESGKLAMGGQAHDGEKTLKALKRLKESPTAAYVSTLRTSNLKRRVSRIEFADPESQRAVGAAFAQLSHSRAGQDEVSAAMASVMSDPEVRLQREQKRYGGAFQGRVLVAGSDQ